MSIPTDAAARAAAAAAARRAAELAAKRAAELAAKKAAEAAAKKAAEAAANKNAAAAAKKAAAALKQKQVERDVSAKAGTKPSASGVRQVFGRDEVSKGQGRALRDRAASHLGATPFPAPSAPTPGRTTSLSELRAVQAREAKLPVSSADDRRTPTSTATVKAPPTPAERAAQGAKDVQKAWDDTVKAGKNQADAANAAAQKLRELTANSKDVAYNNALIRGAQPTLEKISTVLGKNASDDGYTGDHDKGQVKDTVRALSDVATASGPIGSFLIADQIAKKLPNSDELMHVDDGFYEHVENGGKTDLMLSLAASLEAQGKGDAKDKLLHKNEGGGGIGGLISDAWDATGGKLVDLAKSGLGALGDAANAVTGFVGDAANGVLKVVGEAGELAVDVAKGTVEIAGDAAKWTEKEVTAAAEYAAKNGLKLAGEALNWAGDHARELAAKALNVDGQLKQLNSVGDTVTMEVGGKVGLTVVQGGADVEMKITKTEDGYEMQLTGKLSGGVFGGLKIPGFPSAEGEANATGIASATMKFTSLSDVTKAAETVGGIGLATAVGGPAGAAITAGSAGDEIKDILNHFESGSVGLELSAEAKASLGETAGLGYGGSLSAAVTNGARIEVTKGQPPALVLEQSIEAKGNLALGAPVEIPSLGGKLNGGSIDGSATVSAETRVPLPAGFNVGDLVKDPVGAMKKVGKNAIENSTTKLGIDVDVSAGIATEDLPLNLGSNGGLDISLSGEAKTKDLIGALGLALKGDLGGALKELGTKTTLDVDVSKYTTKGFDIDEEVGVPGFTIGVKAKDEFKDKTELWQFEGTPVELAQKGFKLFEALDLNVS